MPADGAVRYRVARWAAAWSVMASTTGTTAVIDWRLGISEYAVFGVMATGEAVELVRFRTSR